MSNLYNEFEEKFKFSWFSAGWVEDEPKAELQNKIMQNELDELKGKDIETLETELELIKDDILDISKRQVYLSNIAKLYR